MRKLLVPAIALALVAAACSDGDNENPEAQATPTSDEPTTETVELDDDDIALVGRLVPFTNCDELLGHFKAEATERVGPYGLQGAPVYALDEARALPATDVIGGFADDAASEAPAGDSGAASDGGGQGGPVYTGTNTQETGVDEPDLVKTDGRRIVTVVDGEVQITDVSGPDPVVVGTVTIPDSGWGEELFISGDRAFVFVNDRGGWFEPRPMVDDAEADFADGADQTAVDEPIQPLGPATRIIEIDLADPRVIGSLRVEGRYLSARSVGDTARVVLSSDPAQLPFVYPSGPSAEAAALEANRAVVAGSSIEDWLPEYTIEDAEGTVIDQGVLPACDRVNRPNEFSGFSVLSVLTLDLDGALTPGEATAVVADGETVYASESALYVATNRWFDPIVVAEGDIAGEVDPSADYRTAVHMFATDGSEAARYLASGDVPGHILNQFSLDEHEGHLRVVTTEGAPWEGGTESSLVVLGRDGDRLVETGRVGGLGRGEQVFSARLVGDRGYVVTFRQIDPFYVLDLSDPTNPRVTGELKIPGFSSYLHPIDTDLVLGVGQQATDEGRITGSKASLFDVSDPTNPVELAQWTLPDSYSAAESEHRAFLWLADRNLAVLPVEAWSDQFVGAVILEVGRGGITEVGRISQIPDTTQPVSDCQPVDESTVPDAAELGALIGDGVVLQLCGPDAVGGYGDWYCDVYPAEDARRLGEDYGVAESALANIGDDDRIEVCWPNGNPFGEPIMRTLQIDDTLWSVSSNRLQGNSLDGLSVTAEVGL